jgi:hypothetical protein
MAILAGAIERGLLPGKGHDDAVRWYRAAAAKGDAWSKQALVRLGVAP